MTSGPLTAGLRFVRYVADQVMRGGGREVKRLLEDARIREYAWLAGQLYRVPRYQDVEVTAGAFRLHVPDAASFLHSWREIFVDRLYEFPFAGRAPRILDLGANIGLSVLFFKARWPDARVVAFEADPRIYAYLRRNLEANGISDVETVGKAAWDADEQLTFLQEGADGGRVSRTGSGTPVSVEAVHLGRLLAAQQFDFIKMDIEGAEARVVPACAQLLGTARWVFIEYHSTPRERQSLADILSVLRDLGFRVHILTENASPRPFLEVRTQGGFDLQLNIMAIREAGSA